MEEPYDINKSIGRLLQVTRPWEITAIEPQYRNKVIDIQIGFERGSKFPCAECGALCHVHDSTLHRIRHLDMFEYRCYLNVKVPRTKCLVHGVKVIKELPWGHTGSHYSFFLKK
jgi:transposase